MSNLVLNVRYQKFKRYLIYAFKRYTKLVYKVYTQYTILQNN